MWRVGSLINLIAIDAGRISGCLRVPHHLTTSPSHQFTISPQLPLRPYALSLIHFTLHPSQIRRCKDLWTPAGLTPPHQFTNSTPHFTYPLCLLPYHLFLFTLHPSHLTYFSPPLHNVQE